MTRLGQMLMEDGMEISQITQLAMNSPYPPASTSLLLLAFMPACIRE